MEVRGMCMGMRMGFHGMGGNELKEVTMTW